MITVGELAAMRATSRAALPDVCTITRRSGTPVLDTTTGKLTAPSATEWTGPVRVRPVTSADQSVVFGEAEQTKQRYVATFPHDVDVALDDIVTVTTSSDPTINDRRFRVAVVSAGSWLIDRRVGVELVE